MKKYLLVIILMLFPFIVLANETCENVSYALAKTAQICVKNKLFHRCADCLRISGCKLKQLILINATKAVYF